MAEVTRLLSETRLLTLTGSGGCGKTRLALEVGASLVGAKHRHEAVVNLGVAGDASPLRSQLAFSDGVWLTQLAPLSDPALVADAVATTFGLRAANRPAREMVIDYLLDRHLLLILDNCEHLIGACAMLADALLRACPDLSLLATSREPLDIPGEVTWRVPSLADDEALQLFTERARAARPDFAVTEQNRPSVAQVCRRLDNIPLAIELAASRLRAFSVEQLAARLSDAFALLTAGNRTALPRQQTLRATIDWSYTLLTEEERALLRTLSVFAGGWTLEAAESVAADVGTAAGTATPPHPVSPPPPLTAGVIGVPALLDQLVNKSLVIAEECAAKAVSESEATRVTEVRYHLLETVRQYAHEQLAAAGEHERAHSKHLAYFADLVQSAQPYIHGPHELEWLDRLDTEVDNLRAALERCAQIGDVPTGERLIDGLGHWWFARGYLQEGRRWIELVLPHDRTAGLPAARATARIASGWLAARIGYLTQASDQFAEAVRLAYQVEDVRLVVRASWGYYAFTVDHEQAVQALTEVLRLARENGLAWDAAWAQLQIAFHMSESGPHDEADRHMREALDGLRTLGNIYHGVWEQALLGWRAWERGDYAAARLQHEHRVTYARALRDPIELADDLMGLADVALRQEDAAGVPAAIQEAGAIYFKVGNLDRLGQCAALAAAVAFTHGELNRAAMLLGAADTLWRPHQNDPGHIDIEGEYHRLLPLVRAAMNSAEFDAAYAEGQKMIVRQVMDEIAAM
jgi:non-specific serine/threonine protein kinase